MPTDGDVVGGTKVSFAEFVEGVRGSGCRVSTISTSRPLDGASRLRRLWLNVYALARVIGLVASRVLRHDVVLFGVSSHAFYSGGPLIWAVCRLARRPLLVRVFGGDLLTVMRRTPRWRRLLAQWTLLRADRLLVESHELAESAPATRPTYFPTARDVAPELKRRAVACRRFVFLAQLRPEKGVLLALEAAATLPEGCTVSFFGPPMPGFDIRRFEGLENVHYGGALRPDEVHQALSEHDAFLLPSFYDGEGLPGAVVEAMQCGLPVIASRWRNLPELIEDEVSGLLVPPCDASILSAAMNRLVRDGELYSRLSVGASARGELFRTRVWRERLNEMLHEVGGVALDRAAA